MRSRFVVLGLALLVALGAGYGVGYAVFQPRLESLRGTQAEQARELETVKAQLAERSSRAQALLQEVGDVTARGTGLEVELRAASSGLDQAKAQLQEIRTKLETVQADLTTKSKVLEKAQGQNQDLERQVASLRAAQKNLDAAVRLQADIVGILNEKVNPALGDATLLARQGVRAGDNGSFKNGRLFFEDAAAAYERAKAEMQKTLVKRKDLASLIPPELQDPFARSVKQEEGRFRSVSARTLEYQAAAKLYLVVDEWIKKDQKSAPDDVKRWRPLVNEAEAQLNEAMKLLDDADEWAPDLWREFEVQRIEAQRWRSLIDGIRFFIIEGRRPPS